MWQAYLLTLFPSVVWVLTTLWLRTSRLSIGRVGIGVLTGIVAGFAALRAQMLLAPLLTSPDRWTNDFLDSVVSAAVIEESVKYICVIAGAFYFVSVLKSKQLHVDTRDIVAIAVSVAIGFMTLENILAVMTAEQPLLRGRDRLLSIFAGHPAFQIMMGVCVAKAIQHRSKLVWLAALGIPVFVHGLIDFAEQTFQDEPNHGSLEDSILFYLWFGSLVTTTVASLYLICAVRLKTQEMMSS